jgi:iron complex transport system substrate-binding protein
VRLPPLALALVALVVAGCGERAEPVDGDLTSYPATLTGAGGDAVTVERAPRRIVALSPGGAELVAALGARERLVGVPAGFEDGPSSAARIVRPSGLVDTARLAALRPDLVVAATETNREELERALEGSDAIVYVQPDRSLRDLVRGTLELGLVLDAPVPARRTASRIRDAAARVERRVADRPRVPVYVDLGFFVTPQRDSIVADLVRRAGGELLGLEVAATPTEPCEVAALEPEVVLDVADVVGASGPPASPFARCARRPRVETVAASLVTVAGPRAGEALEAIARALHADAR